MQSLPSNRHRLLKPTSTPPLTLLLLSSFRTLSSSSSSSSTPPSSPWIAPTNASYTPSPKHISRSQKVRAKDNRNARKSADIAMKSLNSTSNFKGATNVTPPRIFDVSPSILGLPTKTVKSWIGVKGGGGGVGVGGGGVKAGGGEDGLRRSSVGESESESSRRFQGSLPSPLLNADSANSANTNADVTPAAPESTIPQEWLLSNNATEEQLEQSLQPYFSTQPFDDPLNFDAISTTTFRTHNNNNELEHNHGGYNGSNGKVSQSVLPYDGNRSKKSIIQNHKILSLKTTNSYISILQLYTFNKADWNAVNFSTAWISLRSCTDRSVFSSLEFRLFFADTLDKIRCDHRWFTVRGLSSIVHSACSIPTFLLPKDKDVDVDVDMRKLLVVVDEYAGEYIVNEAETTQSVSSVVWSYGTLYQKAPSTNTNTNATPSIIPTNLFFALEARATWLVQHGSPQSISNCIWSFAKMNKKSPLLYTAVESRANWLVTNGSCQTISNTAWGFAKGGRKSVKLFKAIDENAQRLIENGDSQDISNTAWALCTLGFKASKWFEQVILHRSVIFSKGKVQDLSNIAVSFAKSDIRSIEVFRMIGSRHELLLQSKNPQPLTNTLWAMTVSDSLQDPEVYRYAVILWNGIIKLDSSSFNDEEISQLCMIRLMANLDLGEGGSVFDVLPEKPDKPDKNRTGSGSGSGSSSGFSKNGSKSKNDLYSMMRRVGKEHSYTISDAHRQVSNCLRYKLNWEHDLEVNPLDILKKDKDKDRTMLGRKRLTSDYSSGTMGSFLSLDMADVESRICVEYNGVNHYLRDLAVLACEDDVVYDCDAISAEGGGGGSGSGIVGDELELDNINTKAAVPVVEEELTKNGFKKENVWNDPPNFTPKSSSSTTTSQNQTTSNLKNLDHGYVLNGTSKMKNRVLEKLGWEGVSVAFWEWKVLNGNDVYDDDDENDSVDNGYNKGGVVREGSGGERADYLRNKMIPLLVYRGRGNEGGVSVKEKKAKKDVGEVMEVGGGWEDDDDDDEDDEDDIDFSDDDNEGSSGDDDDESEEDEEETEEEKAFERAYDESVGNIRGQSRKGSG